MQQLEGKNLEETVKEKWLQLRDWLKPDPDDSTLVTVIKSFFKAIAVLILIALSPIILVILTFVFVAAF